MARAAALRASPFTPEPLLEMASLRGDFLQYPQPPLSAGSLQDFLLSLASSKRRPLTKTFTDGLVWNGVSDPHKAPPGPPASKALRLKPKALFGIEGSEG